MLVGTIPGRATWACGGDRKTAAAVASDAPCRVAVQRLPSKKPQQKTPVCHRFVAGPTLAKMQQITVSDTEKYGAGRERGPRGTLCLHSAHVRAAVPSLANGSVVLSWDLALPRDHREEATAMAKGVTMQPFWSCLAIVSFPGMALGSIISTASVAAVVFDEATSSVITVGYTEDQRIVATVFNSVTLQPHTRYRLPLSVGWLLHAGRISNGFLLFVGYELPVIGTTFVVDLRTSEVYEQDPPLTPNGHRLPRRRRLPRASFVEHFDTGRLPHRYVAGGPCAASVATASQLSSERPSGSGSPP